MVPKKPSKKPTAQEAIMQWRVIYEIIVGDIFDKQTESWGPREKMLASPSEATCEVAAAVAAEIWKGVDHGNDA
jgi:hypothetical protein